MDVKVDEIKMSLSTNKVLVGHGPAHSFTCGLWRLSCYRAELNNGNRGCVSPPVPSLLSGFLQNLAELQPTERNLVTLI